MSMAAPPLKLRPEKGRTSLVPRTEPDSAGHSDLDLMSHLTRGANGDSRQALRLGRRQCEVRIPSSLETHEHKIPRNVFRNLMLREADNTVISGEMYLPHVKLEQQSYREKNFKYA